MEGVPRAPLHKLPQCLCYTPRPFWAGPGRTTGTVVRYTPLSMPRELPLWVSEGSVREWKHRLGCVMRRGPHTPF
ncbi:hypothetical protein GCM10010335_27840 [Streptomyces galbus]|nr:hypothetical protein GCM10010335_27840 [Streptomyces galbus]